MKIDFTEHHSVGYRIWAPENPMFISEKLTESKLLCWYENVYGTIKKHEYVMKNFIIEHMEWPQMTPQHEKPHWYEWKRDISWKDRMEENLQNDKWLTLK